MNKELREFVVEQTKALIAAPTCCKELKETAQKWLTSLDQPNEAEMTKRYEEELEADLVTVDDLIALANSDLGKQIFGEKAAQVAAHGEKIKAAGARYCDCPACKAVEAILATRKSW